MGNRFSGRQITTIVVAVAVAVVAFPAGVLAAGGSLVTITDPVHPARKASVSIDGALMVGDGGKSLTVDGTVHTQPLAPAMPWSYPNNNASGYYVAAGPTKLTINVTSLTVSPYSGTITDSRLMTSQLPSTATDCSSINGPDLYLDDVPPTVPLVVAFPTPLQIKPTAPGNQVCLWVYVDHQSDVDVSGFYS
jgi:hypothetical protein